MVERTKTAQKMAQEYLEQLRREFLGLDRLEAPLSDPEGSAEPVSMEKALLDFAFPGLAKKPQVPTPVDERFQLMDAIPGLEVAPAEGADAESIGELMAELQEAALDVEDETAEENLRKAEEDAFQQMYMPASAKASNNWNWQALKTQLDRERKGGRGTGLERRLTQSYESWPGLIDVLTGMDKEQQKNFVKDLANGAFDVIGKGGLRVGQMAAEMLPAGIQKGLDTLNSLTGTNATMEDFNKVGKVAQEVLSPWNWGKKLGQWAAELQNKDEINAIKERQQARDEAEVAPLLAELLGVQSEQKGPKATPSAKPQKSFEALLKELEKDQKPTTPEESTEAKVQESSDESEMDLGDLLTAIGSGIGNWSFDPRTGSLTRTDSRGPSLYDILRSNAEVKKTKRDTAQRSKELALKEEELKLKRNNALLEQAQAIWKSKLPFALGGSAYYDPSNGTVTQTESATYKALVDQIKAQELQNSILASQELAKLPDKERKKMLAQMLIMSKVKQMNQPAYLLQAIQNGGQ